MVVNGGAVTFPTGCEAPATGLAQALSNGAIGVASGQLTVQAADCASTPDTWITLSGYLNYDSRYWYNLFVNMNTRSFHS